MTIVIRPQELARSAAAATEIRRRIHAIPEVGLELGNTESVIISALREAGADSITTRVGGPDVTGTVAVFRGNRPGRVIGLRADGDALPMEENTGLPWSSRRRGCMHACGHDGHTATLLAACHFLGRSRDFAGSLVAVFQPGEEGFAGGRRMIEDGLAERFGIEEFYALHAEPSVPVGHVALSPGFMTANADRFEITFEGKGGHGSRPHQANDPVVAACEAVLALQTIVSRNTNPDETAVVSVGSMTAGDRNGPSVIPQQALLTGTARSFTPEVQDLIEHRMGEIVNGVALTHGMKGTLRYERLYPAMYNDPGLTAEAIGLLRLCLGKEAVEPFRRRPGGEDFSFMLLRRPGCLFRLGVRDENHTAGVHNERFDFNDRAIATGAACLLTIALSRMEPLPG